VSCPTSGVIPLSVECLGKEQFIRSDGEDGVICIYISFLFAGLQVEIEFHRGRGVRVVRDVKVIRVLRVRLEFYVDRVSYGAGDRGFDRQKLVFYVYFYYGDIVTCLHIISHSSREFLSGFYFSWFRSCADGSRETATSVLVFTGVTVRSWLSSEVVSFYDPCESFPLAPGGDTYGRDIFKDIKSDGRVFCRGIVETEFF